MRMTTMGMTTTAITTAHPAHESPPVMLVPLAGLALGAAFAGVAFRHWFIGGGFEDFWRNALFIGPANHILEEMEHVPGAGLAVADC